MTILNMVGGGKNPYQPFHLDAISDLAVVGGNTEATITWTDPGDLIVDGQTLATWSSTKLVRKTGSAPTDSSDGTLVVTETVADTYSVSGYTDTGLTNGTTYYYGAFAVADNGLETISNIDSVTPSGGWTPGANTLVYMPIDTSDTASTVYDHSSAGNDFIWYGTADYDTLTSGKRVINLTGSNGIYIDSALFSAQPVTINLWVYRDGNQNNDGNVFANQQDRGGMCMAWFNNSQLASFYDQGGSLVGFNNKYSTSNQTWYNIVVTFGSNTITMYVNGVQYTQNSGGNCDFSSVGNASFGFTRNAGGVDYNRRYMTGKMGDLIVEDKVRTAQEISDYFDLTKSNYGIS